MRQITGWTDSQDTLEGTLCHIQTRGTWDMLVGWIAGQRAISVRDTMWHTH